MKGRTDPRPPKRTARRKHARKRTYQGTERIHNRFTLEDLFNQTPHKIFPFDSDERRQGGRMSPALAPARLTPQRGA